MTDDVRITPEHPPFWQRPLSWIIRQILARIYYVGSPVVLLVQAPPTVCVKALNNASKPNVRQLHLSKLYADGRRYAIQPRREGFRLTTTSKVIWHYRRRTSYATVMRGEFNESGDTTTRLDLRGRINLLYLFTSISFMIPFFMTSILIYTTWQPLLVLTILLVMYGLSWAGHRFHAQLEVNEMIWFVQTALQDFIPSDMMLLDAGEDDGVVYDPHEFEEEWKKFYEAHKPEQ